MPYLHNLRGTKPGRIDLSGPRVVIGRSPDCAVVLDADAVSRHHTQIVRDGQSFFIDDLNSRNGTFVNGSQVFGPTLLSEDSLITIGQYLFAFRSGMDETPARPESELLVTEEHEDSSEILSMRDASSPGTVLLSADVQPEAKLRALLEISQNLRSALRLHEVLPNVLDSLFKILPQADNGVILLRDEVTQRLVPKAIKNRRERSGQALRISRTVIRHVLDHGQALLLSDVAGGSALPTSESIADFKMHSIMCVPLLRLVQQPLGIIQVNSEDREHPFSQDDLDLLVSVASAVAVAVENAQLHEELVAQARLNRELQFARDLQRRFLPTVLPTTPGYEFYAFYEAAHNVGGDYYGFIDLPGDRLAISVGDVAGKGIAAALLMAHLSSDIRFSALTAANPAAALHICKRALIDASQHDKLVTLLLMDLHKANHVLAIGNAGHNAPLLRHPDGRIEPIGEETTGLPLNVDIDPDYRYKLLRMPVGPGCTVLAYTDGLVQAVNAAGEPFGYERLEKIFRQSPPDPQRAGAAVIAELERFIGTRHLDDDVTLVCFGRTAR